MNTAKTTTTNNKKLLAVPLAAALVTLSASAGDAQPKNEYFGGNSNGVPPKGYTNYQGPPPKAVNGVTSKGSGAMDSDASAELTWFEKFDEISFRGRPTDS